MDETQPQPEPKPYEPPEVTELGTYADLTRGLEPMPTADVIAIDGSG